MSRRARLCTFLALAWTTGCVQVLGIDPWDVSGSGGAPSTSSTSGAPSKCLGASAYCVHPPSGWSRLVALTVDDSPCAGAYSIEASVGKTDVVGDAKTCSCSCDPPMGQSCGPPTLKLFNDAGCTMPLADYVVSSGCATLGGAALNGLSVSVVGAALTAGSCTPKRSETTPSVQFGVKHVCGLSEASDACDTGGSCAPLPSAPMAPALCIWAEGDRPCPGGDFSNKTLIYRGANVDTRDCAPCGCMQPAGAACSTSATVFSTTSCGTASGTTSGTCVAIAVTSAQSANATITLTPGTCAVVPSSPTGSVTGSDPITACCTNPLS